MTMINEPTEITCDNPLKYFTELPVKPFHYNARNYSWFNAEEAFRDVVLMYRDFDKKRISRHQVMNTLRDYFYLLETGMEYEEWVEQRLAERSSKH